MKKLLILLMTLFICIFTSCDNNSITKSSDYQLIYLNNKYNLDAFNIDIIKPYNKISDNSRSEDFYYSSYDENINIIKSIDKNGEIKFYFKEGFDKSDYIDLIIKEIILYTTEVHSGVPRQSISVGININKEDNLSINSLIYFENTVHFDTHWENAPMYNFRILFYNYDYFYYDKDYYITLYRNELYVLRDTLNNRAYKINYDYESLIKEGIYAINKLI